MEKKQKIAMKKLQFVIVISVGSNCPGVVIRGNAIVLGGNCPKSNCPRWQLS